jgi:hypothetical protein
VVGVSTVAAEVIDLDTVGVEVFAVVAALRLVAAFKVVAVLRLVAALKLVAAFRLVVALRLVVTIKFVVTIRLVAIRLVVTAAVTVAVIRLSGRCSFTAGDGRVAFRWESHSAGKDGNEGENDAGLHCY